MGHVAVVLAAGQGTRMRSDRPKVMFRVAGRPLVSWVVDATTASSPDRTMVVVGNGASEVVAQLPQGVEHCLQEQRLGTGHAVKVAMDRLGTLPADTPVMVVPGDTPLLTGASLTALVELHSRSGAALTMLTAEPADPGGYGRVVRGEDGRVRAIVEERDADGPTRAIREVNTGMYVFRTDVLAEGLASLRTDNSQGEYYLTDVVTAAVDAGMRVEAAVVPAEDIAGVNTHAQLAEVNQVARRRILLGLMEAGVAVIDPARVYVDATTTVEPGAVLYPGCHLEGATTVGPGAVVGPDVYALDSAIGPGARVWYSVLRQADVGEGCEVGPYASLRPGTTLRRGAKAGTFVEMKNTTVDEGAKVPHLSYMGDATIGKAVNVGAGTITCNYDGFRKYPTVIGDGAFIGSDTMLVAPVTVGEGAMTGAGSVITTDVAPGALAVERADQREIAGYATRKAARYRSLEAETEER